MMALVARSENGVIGKDGGLPWRCKGDLQFFKRTTLHRNILVGRITYDGLPPLKDRSIFVLTRNVDAGFDTATAVSYPDQVPADAIICGGATVYDLMLPKCDELFVTTVKKEVEGDTYFNEQWLDGFHADRTIEETEEYSIIAYKRAK